MEQPQLQAQEPDAKAPNSDVDGMTEMSEMNLREHLLAASAAAASQSQANHVQYRPESSSPQSHLSGHITHPPYGTVDPSNMTGGHVMELDMEHRGKRELSTSKRAAQNRAAQRAFRQRKEGYIKKLEDQVRNFGALETSYDSLQHENHQLRDYVATLQARLTESKVDYPPPPSSVDLQNPRQPVVDLSALREHLAGATDVANRDNSPTPMASTAASQLARAAVQAGEYVAADLERRQHEEDAQADPMRDDSEPRNAARDINIDKPNATGSVPSTSKEESSQAQTAESEADRQRS